MAVKLMVQQNGFGLCNDQAWSFASNGVILDSKHVQRQTFRTWNRADMWQGLNMFVVAIAAFGWHGLFKQSCC